jgi:hypothetical protein
MTELETSDTRNKSVCQNPRVLVEEKELKHPGASQNNKYTSRLETERRNTWSLHGMT